MRISDWSSDVCSSDLVLMTLERPEEGVIWVDGRPLYHQERDGQLVPAKESHVRDVRRDVSMVFQPFNLFPHKTIRDNVTLGPRKTLGLGMDEAEQRARDLLDRVGLSDKIDPYPSAFSVGTTPPVPPARPPPKHPDR